MKTTRLTKRELISIEVNGVRYSHLEDVPEEYRKFLEDKDGNGIPDFIEAAPNTVKNVVRVERRTIDPGDFSDSEIQNQLTTARDQNEDFLEHFSLGNITAHVCGMLKTLLIALVLAIILVITFFVWIWPTIR